MPGQPVDVEHVDGFEHVLAARARCRRRSAGCADRRRVSSSRPLEGLQDRHHLTHADVLERHDLHADSRAAARASELPSCGVMLPRTAVAAGTTFQIVPSLIIVAPFDAQASFPASPAALRAGCPRSCVSSPCRRPRDRSCTTRQGCRSRMLRMTSRSSAPSKLSVTDGPFATAPGAAAGSPPPGCCPLTSTPVPLNTLVVSVPSVRRPRAPFEQSPTCSAFQRAVGRRAGSAARSGR